MTSALASGNHDQRCPSCGQYVPENALQHASALVRINCQHCGWQVQYHDHR